MQKGGGRKEKRDGEGKLHLSQFSFREPEHWLEEEYNYLLFFYKAFAQENLPLCISCYIPSAVRTRLSVPWHCTCNDTHAMLMDSLNSNKGKFLPLVLILKTFLKFTFSSTLSLALCLEQFTSEPLLAYFFQIYRSEEQRSQLSPCLLSQDKHGAYDRVSWDWFTLQFTTQARI